jgi:hypothetical protein
MPRPPHPPRLYNSNYTWRRVQVMKLLVMQFSPPSRYSIPLLLETLFSNTLSLCSSPFSGLKIIPYGAEICAGKGNNKEEQINRRIRPWSLKITQLSLTFASYFVHAISVSKVYGNWNIPSRTPLRLVIAGRYVYRKTPRPLVRKRTIPTERPPFVGEI